VVDRFTDLFVRLMRLEPRLRAVTYTDAANREYRFQARRLRFRLCSVIHSTTLGKSSELAQVEIGADDIECAMDLESLDVFYDYAFQLLNFIEEYVNGSDADQAKDTLSDV